MNFLDHRFGLSKCKVKIDGEDVADNYVRDITLNYSMLNVFVSGSMTLEISGDPLEKQKFEGASTIQIFAIDSQDNEFDNTFIAFNAVSKRLTDSATIVIFQLLDEFSFACSNTFVAKGFQGVSIDDILQTQEICGQFYEQFNSKETDFDSFSDKIDEYVTPSNKSLINVQNQLKMYFNALIYQTRTKYKVKKWETIYSDDDQSDILFKYPCDNLSYIYGVEECRVKQADQMMTNIKGVKTKMYSYNPLDRKKEFIEYDNSKFLSEVGANSIENKTTGVKYDYIPHLNSEQQLKTRYAMDLLLNTQYELICKGNFKTDIGQVISLDHLGNSNTSATLSGKYLIVEICFKFVQNHLTQKMILNKSSL